MARYVVSLPSPWTPVEAFAYLADVTHFAEWDPGVERALRLEGTGPGVGTLYDLTVKAGGRTVMRYRVTAYDAPHRLVLESTTAFLRSRDEIRVEPDGRGSRVTYDAQLDLRGPGRWLDRLLAAAFRRLGDRAAVGLRRALQAEAAP